MSSLISPITDLFDVPLVDETDRATERYPAHEDESGHGQSHPHPHSYAHPHTPSSGEHTIVPLEPDSNPTLGTLLDVKA